MSTKRGRNSRSLLVSAGSSVQNRRSRRGAGGGDIARGSGEGESRGRRAISAGSCSFPSERRQDAGQGNFDDADCHRFSDRRDFAVRLKIRNGFRRKGDSREKKEGEDQYFGDKAQRNSIRTNKVLYDAIDRSRGRRHGEDSDLYHAHRNDKRRGIVPMSFLQPDLKPG